MSLKKMSPFTRMILGAVLGITLGIIFGFLFGVLIAFLANTVGHITNPPSDFATSSMIPYQVASFMGMAVGAIMGAIFGAINANKK